MPSFAPDPFTYLRRRALARVGAAPSAPFTPFALGPALLGYWDAEQASSLSLTGSAVNSWTDLVAGYVMSQGTAASKPTYSATGFNNRPGVMFDGTDDYIDMASVPFPTAANPCEMWVLGSNTTTLADATTRMPFGYGDGADLNKRRYLARRTNDIAGITVGTGAATVTDNAPVAFTGNCVLRGVAGATTAMASVNGSASAGSAAVPSTGTTRTRMGASAATTVSSYWQGQINAVLVTNPLTNEQAAQLTAWAKNRGGIA